MSAVDIVARGLAQRAASAGPTLFAELGDYRPAAGTIQIATAGHSANGVGSARYVHDSL